MTGAVIGTCVWAGVDKVWEQEKLEARKMLLNRADSHTSGARFVGTLLTCKTLWLISFSLFRIEQIPALFVSSNHEHFLNSMNLADFVNHKRIDWLGYQYLYRLPSQHGIRVKHYEFLIPYV